MQHDSRMPADRGLSGLGLLMQLAGGTFATITLMAGFTQLFLLGELRAAGVDASAAAWLLVLMTAGVIRSSAHRAAGTEILYGTQPLVAIHRYVVLAGLQTLLWCVFLHTEDAPMAVVLSIGLLFGAWPLTLAILFARPRLRNLENPPRIAEDKGFEGAGILMIVLGLCGAIYAGMVVMMMLEEGKVYMPGEMKLVLGAMILLVVRSIIHVHAGWQTLTFRDLDRTMMAALRYANFGVIAAMTLGAVLLIVMMKANGGMSGVIGVAGITTLLLVWPYTIRRFVQDRRYDGSDDSDLTSSAQRSVDHGLTALGWLLVALGATALASAVPALFAERADASNRVLAEVTGVSALTTAGSAGWGVLLAALQLWAGLELVAMTERHRLAATVYGVVGTALTIYLNLPLLEDLESMGRLLGREPFGFAAFGGLAIGLVVPLATLVLAQRGGPPTARARYVDRPG